ncbi:MAG: hypothetical protein Q9168_008327 [Polycauliona sp. 1 TL-2023]
MVRLLSHMLLLFFPSLIHAIEAGPLAPANDTSDNVALAATVLKFPPRKAPTLPWNQYTCRNTVLAGDIYLTFTFGDELSRTGVRIAINDSIRRLQLRVRMGEGDEQLSEFGNWVVFYNNETRILVTAKLYRGSVFEARGRFTTAQVLKAVVLLDFCAVSRGAREEMWVEVFVEGGRQLGFVWVTMI